MGARDRWREVIPKCVVCREVHTASHEDPWEGAASCLGVPGGGREEDVRHEFWK